MNTGLAEYMQDALPQFTNEKLIKIKQRCSDSRLLIDLVPVHESFFDEYNINQRISEKDVNLDGEWLRLGFLAGELMKSGKIDQLSTLDLLEGRLEPYPYQMKVALNVLKDKSSNALLADEVGLGKTIEVGLILKEHIIRGNIHSILIITPKALVNQWKDEMYEKFGEEFVTTEDDDFDFDKNRIITSLSKLARNVEKFTTRQWDMVVVDEAHLLINTSSKRRQAVASIDRRYMLLSTATPLCNRLTDIYSLVDLLYPGLLGTLKSFRKKYFEDKAGRVCKPEMKDELKKVISNVMVRTLRSESGIPFTERFIYSLRVEGSSIEKQLYDAVINYMKKTYFNSLSGYGYSGQNGYKSNYFLMKELIILQQSLSSSPRALIRSLENRKLKNPGESELIDPIIELAEQVGNYSKAENLIKSLNNIPGEKAVIFTLRLETAHMLCNSLNENYMSARVYEGRLTGHERQALIEDFRKGKIQYIVATDSAAEGLNLQNASIVVNYDLHWNPMKIEQRIGRVHRRGQEKDVTVFNLVMKDTIDDYVLKVLYEKIELFKMTIGGIEAILSEIKDGDFDIEETIMDILIRSTNKRDIEKEFEKLREDLEYKKQQSMLREEFSRLVLD
ncbi:MAG TPA: DEAD/DEAH box helicase [Clostridiaceae bacterium]|nr:DEAD/DEAH box helicase [Clostridiaceae bacterium]